MKKTHLLLWGVLAIFFKAVLVTGDDERILLADNKCMCTRVTSRIIRSTENPNEDIVERNIRIVVPLNNRENISDPTSPLRTKFVYHLSDLCKKCDPVEVELGDQVVTASQSTLCNEDSAVPETCYMYNRNKCYTSMVPLMYRDAPETWRKCLHENACQAEFSEGQLDPAPHFSASPSVEESTQISPRETDRASRATVTDRRCG
nr:immunoglobulin J chain isoform X1 [Peromyscus maniculatus bairdii]XP_042113540.1 immunoglobulin J chain isoform X1 [Peromyscus maniculatus bairdii]